MSDIIAKLSKIVEKESNEEVANGLRDELFKWLEEGRYVVMAGALIGKDAMETDMSNPLIRMGMTGSVEVAAGILHAAYDLIDGSIGSMNDQLAEARSAEQVAVKVKYNEKDKAYSFKDVQVNEAVITRFSDKGPIFDGLQEIVDDLRIRDAGFILVFQTKEGHAQIESNTIPDLIPDLLDHAAKKVRETNKAKSN